MVMEYQGQKFKTDEDLKVEVLGFWPRININDSVLKERFQDGFDRSFLGGDELVSYAQTLVSGGMDFGFLEENILNDMNDSEKDFGDFIFKKTATGIGRGHSLGGLSGVVLGLNGTKMIDSGLTGFVASRSLATSSRRRETTEEEIVVPQSLFGREDLLKEYLKISKDVFDTAKIFKSQIGKISGVETFNKVLPYNNPGDLFIVLPLDTMASLAVEVREDRANPNGNFLPKELWALADMFPDLTKSAGMDVMYNQRIKVPRDTYFHYHVFKDSSLANSALEFGQSTGMSIHPKIVNVEKDFTDGFRKRLAYVQNQFEKTNQVTDPEELVRESMNSMLALRSFVGEYNDTVKIKIADSLSWRVWSEQKRHATLRQNVESVYSGVERAQNTIGQVWDIIEEVYEKKKDVSNLPLDKIEEVVIMDKKLKKDDNLLISYLYHTARQLMFSNKLVEEGFEKRDVLFSIPKNIKLRTTENYDLVNLVDLEFPLRLCSACEPERYASSWEKRELIAKAVPELDYFLSPKCNVGFCTEGKSCNHIYDMREYSVDLHKTTKQAMLG